MGGGLLGADWRGWRTGCDDGRSNGYRNARIESINPVFVGIPAYWVLDSVELILFMA